MRKGIDVSSYQGDVDWAKVKNDGVEFAIIKIIRKDLTPDKKVLDNVKGCLLNGIEFSFYNYSYATNTTESENAAKKVVEIIVNLISSIKSTNGLSVELFNKYFTKEVWMDIEDECQMKLGHTLIDIAKIYQKNVEDSGYEFGIYTGLSFYNSYLSKYANELNNPFWMARYYQGYTKMLFVQNPNESKIPKIKNALWGWQYTSSGIVNGIKGGVDLNIELDSGKENEVLSGVCEFSRIKDGKKYLSKNFTIDEFRCKDGSDKILIDVDFVRNKLQNIRSYFNSPLTINSAYRTDAYNKKVGGATNSYHKKGQAFDIVVKGRTPHEIAIYASMLGINGIIEYNTFVHVDSRSSKYWARNNNGKITVLNKFS